ncbi:MAG: hypothetical protein KAX15_04090, partial [Candidatus Omnitrophica bacterium]|nr:hypothetical protein [Candidatus Omnitrophota bacterium]
EEGVEVSGAISPYVTIHLKDIPMIEALDLMLRTKDLKYRVEENLIWITTVETLEKENFKTRVFNLSSGAGAIKDIIEEVVSFPEGSSINLDARSDTLIVTHTPTKLEVIRDIVMALDQAPIQVEIQARFLEVKDEFAEEFASGILANNVYMKTKDLDLDYQSPDHLGKETEPHYSRFNSLEMDSPGITDTLRLDLRRTVENTWSAAFEAMAAEEKIKVLSEPSVTTLNNMSAAIRMTESVTYPGSYSVETETEVGPPGTTDYKQSKLKTGDTVSKDTGIISTVKPSVGDDRKTISLSLLPRVIELVSWTTLTLPNDSKIHLPKFEERRVETSLIINDGETVILGGLSKQSENKYKDGIPGLINIPFLGSIFAKKTKSDLTNSLLIFVTARIVSPSGG